MNVKVLEIRDRATMIPALAIRQSYPVDRCSVHLLSHVGFGRVFEDQCGYVFLMRLVDHETQSDPNCWTGRTMHTAHRHICDHWDDLEDGSVIDVEYLLGESDMPKTSDVNAELLAARKAHRVEDALKVIEKNS